MILKLNMNNVVELVLVMLLEGYFIAMGLLKLVLQDQVVIIKSSNPKLPQPKPILYLPTPASKKKPRPISKSFTKPLTTVTSKNSLYLQQLPLE